MASIIAKRYANALFSLAVEENQIDEINSEVLVLLQVLEENESFIEVVNHPQLNEEEKVNLIKTSFGDIHESLKGLIHIMLVKGRFEEFYNTLKVFSESVKAHKNILDAKIISATPLNDERIEKIKSTLSTNLNKEIIITTEVDESLIGGFLIEVDGRIIDGTIKKQITDVKQGLLNSSF